MRIIYLCETNRKDHYEEISIEEHCAPGTYEWEAPKIKYMRIDNHVIRLDEIKQIIKEVTETNSITINTFNTAEEYKKAMELSGKKK